MNDRNFEKYNTKRNEIIAKYKKQKLTNVFSVLGIGAALILIVFLLKDILNIAVTLVLIAVIAMITIIFARIRYVSVNYVMEQKLRDFENEDPTFY